MDEALKITLIADGSSDACLKKIIEWTLNSFFPSLLFDIQVADFRNLSLPPKTLKEKVNSSRRIFPHDILIIHRDSEKSDPSVFKSRLDEINNCRINLNDVNIVPLIPVVMMESWLLIDKEAIKKAAGNRNFSSDVELPKISTIETLNEPKKILHDLLKEISGRKGRLLKKFNVHEAVHLVAENIEDFSALRYLKAFQFFETELKTKVNDFLLR